MTSDGWDPVRYGQFATERAQPFWDLVELLGPTGGPGFRRGVDLGCGSGELTNELADRLGVDEMVGIDSSDAMLAAARKMCGVHADHVRFARGDIAQWTSRADHDLVIANASLQWVPDHVGVLTRWWAGLAPGGQLAVQVPANADHASHLVAAEVATTEPFLAAFESASPLGPPPDPVAANVLAPEQYAVLFDDLGAVDQHVRLQVYPHRLASTASVVDWTQGTTLTRFTKLLDDDLADCFVAAYRERLLDRVGDQAPYFYPFKRILMWGRRSPESTI